MVKSINMANTKTSLSINICSFNCRGFNNSNKKEFIAQLTRKCDIILLQEHWLDDSQLDILNSVDRNMLYVGVSGFDSATILSGRPYGGCAILWKSNILDKVNSIVLDSKRISAVCIYYY